MFCIKILEEVRILFILMFLYLVLDVNVINDKFI